ncbi:MAG: transglutaminase family protein [Acetivibrionales bacterium]
MLKPETNDMNRYLQMTDIIDFRHNLVRAAAEKLRTDVMKKAGVPSEYGMPEFAASEKYNRDAPGTFNEYTAQVNGYEHFAYTGCYEQAAGYGETAYVKAAFEYVRDAFPHSFDLLRSGKPVSRVSCKASDVLHNGHGICYAKSHLLAALLRIAGIPAGFCYQKLQFSDEDPSLILHAVSAVYLYSLGKWIRLDARGNHENVNAQFSTDKEFLAFPVRPELGEEDGLIIYAEPAHNVVEALNKSETIYDLIKNLPGEV